MMKSLSTHKPAIRHRWGLRRIAMPALTMGLAVAALVACGGGGGGSGASSSGVVDGTCNFGIAAAPQALTAAEVEQLVARAVEASGKLGFGSTIAVVDRVGNVLAVYRMTGAGTTVNLRSGRFPGTPTQGIDRLDNTIASDLAAIAKAITGAYLSSSGNAFSTRTASAIVQDHFPAGVLNQPSGPLFGVQFSQLPCGDLVTRGEDVRGGPHRSPLGLAGDPGGFPLYKNGHLVGGIGVMADGIYGLDTDPTTADNDVDERIAQSALRGFEAPACIRGDRITAGGIALTYSDADAQLVPVSATSLADPLAAGRGSFITVPGYLGVAAARAGTAYGTGPSGVVADAGAFAAVGGHVLADSATGANRYAPMASVLPLGSPGMSAADVREILSQAKLVADQARAQIRRPVGSAAQVSISVVDAGGNVLGLVRSADAPIFGADVSLQKARTAAFFSSRGAAALLAAQPSANYVSGIGVDAGAFSIASYLADPVVGARAFFADNGVFGNGTAFTPRAIGNIARPTFPDGIDGTVHGPFSKPIASWSPFNPGLQLDLVYSRLVASIVDPTDNGTSCTAAGANSLSAIRNGIQVFPGGVPIYRNGVLIGAVGVSGDGVDQDDMIAFLGLARAAAVVGGGLGNAPAGLRADNLQPRGVRLRYAQCPQAPFNNSDQQGVCSAL